MPEEYIDLDAAAKAAEELLNAGRTPDEETEEVEEQSVEPEVESATPDETTEEEAPAEAEDDSDDFIPRADLEALLEGLEGEPRERVITAYKSFQRLSTKRNQEVSALRRAFDGVDPEEAKRAYEFVQNLSSDPQFATQVYNELATALEEAGMSPAAASRAATEAIESKVTEATPVDDGLDEYADNPFVQQLKETQARLDAMEKAAREREEAAAREARDNAVIAEIERQHQEIRRENPDFDDDDMDSIFKIAASMQGDLFQAKEYYEALQDRLVTEYVAKKKAVPKGQAAPSRAAAPYSEEPVEILNTDQAHVLAVERARQLLSAD